MYTLLQVFISSKIPTCTNMYHINLRILFMQCWYCLTSQIHIIISFSYRRQYKCHRYSHWTPKPHQTCISSWGQKLTVGIPAIVWPDGRSFFQRLQLSTAPRRRIKKSSSVGMAHHLWMFWTLVLRCHKKAFDFYAPFLLNKTSIINHWADHGESIPIIIRMSYNIR